MNHENEFTRLACSRSKFSIGFSLKKKECFKRRITSNKKYDSRNMSLLNKLPSSTSCLPTDPICILSFLALVAKKVEKSRMMSREEKHTENLFLGFYNIV